MWPSLGYTNVLLLAGAVPQGMSFRTEVEPCWKKTCSRRKKGRDESDVADATTASHIGWWDESPMTCKKSLQLGETAAGNEPWRLTISHILAGVQ